MTGLYNRDGVCLLRGTDWILMYIVVTKKEKGETWETSKKQSIFLEIGKTWITSRCLLFNFLNAFEAKWIVSEGRESSRCD